MNSHRRWGVRDVHLFDCKEVCGAAYLHFQYCSWSSASVQREGGVHEGLVGFPFCLVVPDNTAS